MPHPDIPPILSACPQLQALDPSGLDTLQAHAALRHLNPGERLWTQGAAADTVCILAGGLVRISTQGDDGSFLTTSRIRDNHLIGEAEIFAGVPRRFNEAVALSPQRLVSLPGAVFRDCVNGSPALMRHWLQASNQRLILAVKHAQGIVLRTAEERLHALIRLLLKYNATPVSSDTVTLPFSQEDLGSMAALTRQAACKVIADWRAQGLVDSGYQRLDILCVAHFRG